MQTLCRSPINNAVRALREGEVIAYPTEAVYGLGCDPLNSQAITKILQLKQRSIDQGFILVAETWDQLQTWIEPIEPRALCQVLASWPGPTTWVFPAASTVPQWIGGKYQSIAVRVSDHPIVRKLCHKFDGPLVSTSANLHGQPPIRDIRTLKITFGDSIKVIVEGPLGNLAHPTTIKNAITGEILRN